MIGSFIFQAADGIRDGHVTGVQTCALPIYATTRYRWWTTVTPPNCTPVSPVQYPCTCAPATTARSEERRVGKEGSVRRLTQTCNNKERKVQRLDRHG